MRHLSLHISALNDAEYALYTSSLNDIADDAQSTTHDDTYYEQMKIGVREARAWLRGRYSHVPATSIDAVLKFFSPSLSQADTMTGGQFFAALRLVVHTETGKEVDRALAFVQAFPSSASKPAKPSPPKRQHADLPPPPPVPIRRHNPDNSASSGESQNVSSHNPWLHNSSEQYPQPPQHPQQRNDPPPISQPGHSYASHNPFLHRGKGFSTRSEDGPPKLPPLPPRKPPPPIPAQPQPTLIPPPRHASVLLQPVARSISPSKSPNMTISPLSGSTPTPPAVPPPPPPKLASHVTSTLMKQSLQASKTAQTMKKAEEQLEKERVLQVLKSSSVIPSVHSPASTSMHSTVLGTSLRNRSSSPNKNFYAATTSSSRTSSDEQAPPLPHRRNQYSSPPTSTGSLEQVALTSTSFHHPPPRSAPAGAFNTFTRSSPSPYGKGLFRSPAEAPTNTAHTNSSSDSLNRASLDLTIPPPTHPDRKPSHFPYHSPSYLSTPSSSHTDISTSSRSQTDSFDMVYGPTSDAPSPTTTTRTSFSAPGSGNSPTSRLFRSKSLHHPSPPPPPVPPPPRRKRPESIQVLGSPADETFPDSPRHPSTFGHRDDYTNTNSNPHGGPLSRHMSLSTPSHLPHRRQSSLSLSSATSAPQLHHPHDPQAQAPAQPSMSMSNVQRALATLQPKLDALQPRLDKARYKAEAGLSRRGFLRDGTRTGVEGEEEGLVGGGGDRRGRGGWDNARSMLRDGRVLYDEPPSVNDDDGNSGDDPDYPRRRSESGVDGGWERDQWAGVEKDNLKWPAGEGWKPL